MVENEALMLAARILALVLLAAASPAGAQNAPVEDTDTLDHAGENAQTLFSRMSLGAPLFDRRCAMRSVAPLDTLRSSCLTKIRVTARSCAAVRTRLG